MKMLTPIVLVCCAALLAVLAGCAGRPERPSPAQGAFIAGVRAEGRADEGFAAARLTDNSGMSGSEGRRQDHDASERAMWRVSAGDDKLVSVAFDLGQVVPLGELWVWNYNAAGNGRASVRRGMKDVRIAYSVDGAKWTEWKGHGYPFRLAAADGSDTQAATNLDDGRHSPIRFDGTPARYVRLTADNVPGEGNWEADGGERIYGLSEVRFYRYALQAKVGGRIVPAAAAAEGTPVADERAINAVNGYGMSGDWTDAGTHGNEEDSMWLASPADGNETALTVDLGGAYPLRDMQVWNYNGRENAACGIRNARIYYSQDGKRWTELKGPGYPYQFAEADGSPRLGATNLNDGRHSPVDFGGASARYVRLVPTGGAGDGNWNRSKELYGLSELRFTAADGWAAEPAPDWTALFSRYAGWTGADGIFSIPLNGVDAPGGAEGTRTLFVFSDTFVGKADPVTRQRAQADMLHNSIAVLDGGAPDPAHIRFAWLPDSADVHLFTPKTPHSPKGSWYWPQDGAAVGDSVYLFPLVVVKDGGGAPGFSFAVSGVNLIRMPIVNGQPEPGRQEQFDTPLFTRLPDGKGTVAFGAGIMANTEQAGAPHPDGYLYVYGYRTLASGGKQLVAARVMPEDVARFGEWRYWDGKGWSSDMLDCAPLEDGVSPELSVSPIPSGPDAGKILLVAEKDTLSGYVAIGLGTSPVGPFTPLRPVYYTPEASRGGGVFTYNAKAHPSLSAPGEWLISYNVNTQDPMGNAMDADIYHPRWIRLRRLGG